MRLRKLLALLLALCMLTVCPLTAQGEGITTPTDQEETGPVEPPTATPTVEPTAEPTVEPTAGPTAESTVEPTAVPTAETGDTPTEEPVPAWDESQCDHANENCEQAPACDIPGCEHIGLDENGLEIPLCAKGLWLLDQQDRLTREGKGIMTRSVRSNTIDLNKADAVIYRSGSYKVTGGNLRPGAALTVAAERLVVLELTDVVLGEIRLGDSVQLTLKAKEQNSVTTLILGKDNEVRVTEGGAITIEKVQRPNEPDEGEITITGGSVKAALTEKDGRELHAFPAKSAAAVTVDGKTMSVNCAHEDGFVYLWLEPPEQGKKWTATMNGTTLEVIQESDVPDDAEGTIIQGQENHLEAGTWELSGPIEAGTLLKIDQSGVTLILTDVTFEGTLVEASCPYTLYAKGETVLTSDDDVLAGTGSPRIVAEGKLSLLGGVQGAPTYEGGAVILSQIPAGYESFAVGQTLERQSVILDGKALPLLLSEEGALLLPSPEKGKSYAMAADEAQIVIHTIEATDKWFTLSEMAPDAVAGDAATFTVEGSGSYVTGRVTAENATANASFSNVQLQNTEAVLALTSEHLTVNLEGDNGLIASEGDAISLENGSTLALNVVSGRLLIRQQKDMNGLTLQGNIKVEPEPTLPHTVLMIRDSSGNPVPNTALTVMIDGKKYEFTTHFDGSIHLWGMGTLTGQDVAATDGTNVYTAVIMDGTAEVHPGLTISDVKSENLSDGTVKVTFTCDGAETVGVQAYIGDGQQDMADTFIKDALRFEGSNGEVIITGVEPGQTVSFRVYASVAEGAELTEDTADGFQFSEVYYHAARIKWSTEESADAVYTGKVYQNPLTLPQGAQVTYSGDNLNRDGLPMWIGQYVMHVTIPEGDAAYLPGVTDIPFEITRIVVTIIPEPNQEKYQGDMDPMFLFEVKGLLDGDELWGELLREEGEEVGNYAFITDGFEAAEYYTLRIASGAPVFTILPMMDIGGGGFFGVFEKLYPVRQEIVRADKRTVAVVLNTQDSLTVTHSVIGHLIFDSDDNQYRPFSPSLSWNQETDEVLLRMRAEAELNDDGGYVTDAVGNPLWGGRYMRLSWLSIRHLYQLGIDAISLSNSDAALTFRLEDFLTEEMESLVKEYKGSLKTVRYRFEVVPVEEMDMDTLRPITTGWRMAVYMVIDKVETDITDQLPGLIAAVDMEPTAVLLQGMDLYEEDTFAEHYALAVQGQNGAQALETLLVQPYMPDELEKVPYPCLLYTHRYLVSPLTEAGVVCAVNLED